MPIYSFKCLSDACGREFDVVCGMAEIGDARPRCPECDGAAYRHYKPPQVIQDTLPEGEVAVSSLKPMNGDEQGIPRVSTRSELKKLVEYNNKTYGLNLEHAG